MRQVLVALGWWVWSALFSIGCAAPLVALQCTSCSNEVGWDVDPAFTTPERNDIYTAIGIWEQATPNWSTHLRHRVVHIERVYKLQDSRVGECTMPRPMDNDVTIRLLPMAQDPWFRRAVVHELGHAAGLQHVSGVESVMRPMIDEATDKPTPLDVKALE